MTNIDKMHHFSVSITFRRSLFLRTVTVQEDWLTGMKSQMFSVAKVFAVLWVCAGDYHCLSRFSHNGCNPLSLGLVDGNFCHGTNRLQVSIYILLFGKR